MNKHHMHICSSEKAATDLAMGQGKALPPEVHWIVVQLSAVMSKEEVSMYTDIPQRSVERILQYYCENGGVKEDDKHARVVERRTHLQDIDVQVSSLSHLTYLLLSYDVSSTYLE
jgi:hypothetical protein